MISHYRYFDQWREALVNCPECWSGRIGDVCNWTGFRYDSLREHEESFLFNCPECDRLLAVIAYPTKEEIENASQSESKERIQLFRKVRDEVSLLQNEKRLDTAIRNEKALAKGDDRHEGLVYVYALNYTNPCSECNRPLNGKVFLLFDGRTQTRFDLPRIPNPYCFRTRHYETDNECGFIWNGIHPESQYLKLERRFYGDDRKYGVTWNLKQRIKNEEEWQKWFSQQTDLELYKPPRLIDSITLTESELFCILNGRIKVQINGRELTLKDLGLLSLFETMITLDRVGAFLGLRLQNYNIDFSTEYPKLNSWGMAEVITMMKKIRYQLSGGNLSKPENGTINHADSNIVIRTTRVMTKASLDFVIRLTGEDIRLMCKNGLSPFH